MKEAWDLGYTGRGVVVTILDDGLERTHPDIAPNYVCFVALLLLHSYIAHLFEEVVDIAVLYMFCFCFSFLKNIREATLQFGPTKWRFDTYFKVLFMAYTLFAMLLRHVFELYWWTYRFIDFL